MTALRIRVKRLEEASRPVDVIAVRTDSNEAQRLFTVARGPGSVAPKLRGILFGAHIATASPALIADAPQIHVEGFPVSIRSALRRECVRLSLGGGVGGHITCGSVAVLDLLVEVARRKRTKVGCEVRLTAD